MCIYLYMCAFRKIKAYNRILEKKNIFLLFEYILFQIYNISMYIVTVMNIINPNWS